MALIALFNLGSSFIYPGLPGLAFIQTVGFIGGIASFTSSVLALDNRSWKYLDLMYFISSLPKYLRLRFRVVFPRDALCPPHYIDIFRKVTIAFQLEKYLI